jgi:hypothetical protein
MSQVLIGKAEPHHNKERRLFRLDSSKGFDLTCDRVPRDKFRGSEGWLYCKYSSQTYHLMGGPDYSLVRLLYTRSPS